jgi:transcriptional regulator with XRE-family HTH domain
MDVIFLLDSTADICKCKNDSQLARALKVTPGAINNYRRGVSAPNAIVCSKIAEITGIPLAKVLGIAGEARALSAAEKAVWRRLANVAAIAVFVGVNLFVLTGQAATLTAFDYMHYAKYNIGQ